MTSIVDGFLYLGSSAEASDLPSLQALGVRRILNVSTSSAASALESELLCFHQGAEDSGLSFLPCLTFLEEARAAGEGVLVHDDGASVSRAPSVVMAYIMFDQQLDVEAARGQVAALWAATSLGADEVASLQELQDSYDENNMETSLVGEDGEPQGGVFLGEDEGEVVDVDDGGEDPDMDDEEEDAIEAAAAAAAAGEAGEEKLAMDDDSVMMRAAAAAEAEEQERAAAAAGGGAKDDLGESLGSAEEVAAQHAPDRDDASLTFGGHADAVFAVGLHPSKPLAISGGAEDKGVIWSTEDGSMVHDLGKHGDSVTTAAFSSDGELAATGGYDGCIKVWNVASGDLVQTLEGPEEIEWMQARFLWWWVCGGAVVGVGAIGWVRYSGWVLWLLMQWLLAMPGVVGWIKWPV